MARHRGNNFAMSRCRCCSNSVSHAASLLIWVLTRGGPINATHLMATLSFQRAIPGGALGEGAAIATAMIPFLLAAILFSYFGLQRRRWQQGGSDK